MMTIGEKMLRSTASIGALAAMIALASPSQASVTISTGTTENMNCSGGVCQPTASSAVLNVADLETLLASGATTVTTTGSGVQADDILVTSGLTWTSAYALSLDAWRNISIHKPVSVDGGAGLSINTNEGGKGGVLLFPDKGSITFASLSSTLSINGTNYTLVGDVKTLATGIADDPTGSFALAADYNASADGTYLRPPISTTFSGTFEGLGHQIQRLTIDDPNAENIGLFADLDGGRISNIGLIDCRVTSSEPELSQYGAGTLLGYNDGIVTGSYSTGHVTGGAGVVGGLIGLIGSAGTVERSHSSANVSLKNTTGVIAAGLVGWNYGTISASYATGAVFASTTTEYGVVGGLVATNDGNIRTSFATGNVTDEATDGNPFCGGLVASSYYDDGQIENTYATGSVYCGAGYAGGFASDPLNVIQRSYSTGKPYAQSFGGFLCGGSTTPRNLGPLQKDYWDTTTSGTNDGSCGGQVSGLTGLTSEQLQSGLPEGFSRTIWSQSPHINNGFPYLIANPPPQ